MSLYMIIIAIYLKTTYKNCVKSIKKKKKKKKKKKLKKKK